MMSYIRSDGNGAYVVTKGAMAFILLLIALLSAIIPTVLAFGVLQTKVDNLEKKIETDEPLYSEQLSDLRDEVAEGKVDRAVLNQKLLNIEENIMEIGENVKHIKNRLDKDGG